MISFNDSIRICDENCIEADTVSTINIRKMIHTLLLLSFIRFFFSLFSYSIYFITIRWVKISFCSPWVIFDIFKKSTTWTSVKEIFISLVFSSLINLMYIYRGGFLAVSGSKETKHSAGFILTNVTVQHDILTLRLGIFKW